MGRSPKYKSLVIGGAGFIGSHVADELSDLGHEVIILDQVQSPYLRSGQQMIVGDLSRKTLIAAMQDVDYVFHFAAVADIKQANQSPLNTISTNVMGSANVFDACRTLKVKKLVMASTIYVYSEAGGFYRATKQAAEELLKTYAQQFGLRYSILRFGSLYGPRAQDWNGINGYISSIIKDGKITYCGDGNEQREYIHIFDAARLTTLILDSKYDNQSLIITGQQMMRSRDLLELIFEIIGKKPDIIFDQHNRDKAHYSLTPYCLRPDIARKLNPAEFIDIGQGILNLLAEFDDQHKN